MDQSIIKKIQKLLTLGSSSNEAEANLAMAKAQELLARYNLQAATVQDAFVPGTSSTLAEKREKTRISRSAKFRWQQGLWKAIAEANFCWYSIVEVYEGKRGVGRSSKVPVRRHCVIGTESNVMAVRMMGEYLEDTLERLVVTDAGYTNQSRMSRSAISWKSGCAERLAERIAELAEERKGTIRESDGGSSTALVLRDVYQREYEANFDFRYGKGAYARKLIQDAEWETRQKEREAKAHAEAEKAEKEWLEYLKTESPQQKKVREREELRQRIREEKRWARQSNSYWRQKYSEAKKVDNEAYNAGKKKAEKINLSPQLQKRSSPTKGIE